MKCKQQVKFQAAISKQCFFNMFEVITANGIIYLKAWDIVLKLNEVNYIKLYQQKRPHIGALERLESYTIKVIIWRMIYASSAS